MALSVRTLKPAGEWSDKEVAQAPYDLKHLHGPPLTGRALTAFRLLCENVVTKEVLYTFYMAKNQLPEILTYTVVPEAPKTNGVPEPPLRPEAGVAAVADAGSPASRVRAALAALGGTAAVPPPSAARGNGAAAGGGRKRGGAATARAQRERQNGSGSGDGSGSSTSGGGVRRPTILDYHAAYAAGDVTPSDVAEAVIAFLSNEPGAANWLCEWAPDHVRAQAAAATARYRAGAPLSALDGVPYAVKDAVDVYAHTTGSGTAFLGAIRGRVPEVALEAPAVAALRSLGAVLVGKTQMQEFGLLPTGISARLGLARNPHDPACIPGGSSGGSACLVAAGVVPFAVGTDGGGSVRIPAALCGVVGFKPTQGRMASEPDGCSLVTLGPITTNTADALLVYAAMACPNGCFKSPLQAPLGARRTGGGGYAPGPAGGEAGGSRTAREAQQEVDAAIAAVAASAACAPPPASLGEDVATRPPLALPLPGSLAPFAGNGGASAVFAARPLKGVRVGVFRPWFADADADVAAGCEAALGVLKRLGAEAVSVTLPELDTIRAAHLVTFLSECYALNRRVVATPSLHQQLHEDSRVIMSIASKFTGAEYLQAARLRRRQAVFWRRAFEACDLIVSPATACAAPKIFLGAEACGMMDLTQCGRLVRFTQAANLLGFPAVTLPLAGAAAAAGAASGSAAPAPLPVAVQLTAQPWHDAALFAAAAALEAGLRAEGLAAGAPALAINPLEAAPGHKHGGSPRKGARVQ